MAPPCVACAFVTSTTGWPVIGMVGGGQLARMTQPAAIALGVRLAVLAAQLDDAAAQVVPATTVADEGLGRPARVRPAVRRDHVRPRARAAVAPAESAGGGSCRSAQRRRPDSRAGQGRDAVAVDRRWYPCPRHRIVFDPADVVAFSADLNASASSELSGGVTAEAGGLTGLTSRAALKTPVVLKTTRGVTMAGACGSSGPRRGRGAVPGQCAGPGGRTGGLPP